MGLDAPTFRAGAFSASLLGSRRGSRLTSVGFPSIVRSFSSVVGRAQDAGNPAAGWGPARTRDNPAEFFSLVTFLKSGTPHASPQIVMFMHPVSPPLPAVDDAAARQVVLRDGSVAGVRVSTHADVAALGEFFRDLSAESRYRRFFTAGEPADAVIARLSDATNPAQGPTLIAQPSVGGELRIVAMASYMRLGADVAEVAFAVADQFQGKGLGTALLERLAVAAANEGFRRFRFARLARRIGRQKPHEIKGFPLLQGYRGRPAADLEALRDADSREANEPDRRRHGGLLRLGQSRRGNHILSVAPRKKKQISEAVEPSRERTCDDTSPAVLFSSWNFSRR